VRPSLYPAGPLRPIRRRVPFPTRLGTASEPRAQDRLFVRTICRCCRTGGPIFCFVAELTGSVLEVGDRTIRGPVPHMTSRRLGQLQVLNTNTTWATTGGREVNLLRCARLQGEPRAAASGRVSSLVVCVVFGGHDTSCCELEREGKVDSVRIKVPFRLQMPGWPISFS
jgi:hypothetical protein